MFNKNESSRISKNEGKIDSINNYIFPNYEESQIKEAFDIFDFNGNNFISALELKEIFHYINEEVTEEEIDEMISLADKEGDGQVNWVNFYEFISGKIINEDIKQMEKTPGLYPENNFNKQQHLEKEKTEFINLNENDNKFKRNKIKKEESIKSISNNKKENNENKNNLNNLNDEDINDENYNDDEDERVDNYVQEILQKRKERLQNNYLVNNAKIYKIKDKNNQKPKKILFKEDNNSTQKNKEIIYNSFSESSINSSKEDENNINNENRYLKSHNNIEDEKNKTKNSYSNFLPLDRTNSLKKIKPILNEVNNYEEKYKKNEVNSINIKNNKIKKYDFKNKFIKNNLNSESDSEKEKKYDFTKKIKNKNKNILFQSKNFNISKENSNNTLKAYRKEQIEKENYNKNNNNENEEYYENDSKKEDDKFNKKAFLAQKNNLRNSKINEENFIKYEEEEEESDE